jgi:epsilon-lactone hydrolase
MVSPLHEQMVARLVAAGVRTPETVPNPVELAEQRRAEASTPVPPPGEGTHVEEVDAGGVAGIWVAPAGPATRRIVVYLHGGGYLWMSARTHQAVMSQVAMAAQARCLGVDYRRAPEHPFPAAVDDALTAYRWLLDQGTDPADVLIAGDSAGGGLVLALLLAAREAGLELPAGAVCISPWTDLAVTGRSAEEADDPIVNGAALRAMAAAYLAGADPRHPLASPLYADLSGLPPLLIQVGTRESLLDDARRVAHHAESSGVDVTLVEHPDVIHMWLVFDPDLPESRTAFRLIGAFAESHLH